MYEYHVKEIIKIVDGDTVDLVLDLGFSTFVQQRLRLKGIDTPELSSTNESERIIANEAKGYVSVWLINQKKLTVKTFKDDKYGRIIAEIYGDDSLCLNKILIDNGYAWEYDGSKPRNNDVNILLEKRKINAISN
jgi:micrococcal nuclease